MGVKNGLVEAQPTGVGGVPGSGVVGDPLATLDGTVLWSDLNTGIVEVCECPPALPAMPLKAGWQHPSWPPGERVGP